MGPATSHDSHHASRWLDDEQQAAWRRTIAGSIHLVDQLDRDLRAAHGLTLADYEILVHLSEAPDRRLRMAELAAAALVSRSRLTHRIDRMDHRGLVEREACDTDKRGTFAVLTDAGRELLVESAPTHVDSVRRYVVDRLSPAQLAALGEAMGEVAAAVGPTD
ncbi:MAG: MarR family transcriptional regulator [Acidimicrobiia bacterium]|nr:MarR family transcriptional regulator [Acidimicrobiia bacterium]